MQAVTDAATELTTAEFGAFFTTSVNDAGKASTLDTISGVPRDAFAKFPMPRNTEVFEPTFKGTGSSGARTSRRIPLRPQRAASWDAGRPPARALLPGSAR